MKLRMKATLLVLSAGVMTLSWGSCMARWLGDAIGDQIFLRAID